MVTSLIPLIPSPVEKGTVLRCKSKQYNYHINSYLYSPFLKSIIHYDTLQKARAVRRWPSPIGEGRDEAFRGLILHLLLRLEKERYCISLIIFITTTSTSYLYSTIFKHPD